MAENYTERTYRQLVRGHLNPMRVTVQESDLSIYANGVEASTVKEAILEQRGYIEGYIQAHPEFATSLSPLPEDRLAPPIVQEMLQAGRDAGVGPMAAVAGAMAERVGRSILEHTDAVIVENGGDIFLTVQDSTTIGIYAGDSPLSMKIGLKIETLDSPMSVCTSSGTIGHSKSYGKSDAVCVISHSCALADASATAIANRVASADDVDRAIQWGQGIAGILGIIVVIGDKMGAWGQIELTAISG